MAIQVRFPGGRRVDARVGEHCIRTDQTVEHGGAGAAPEPFDLFLASIATCAGIYVLGFCEARRIPTAGIWLEQHDEVDPKTHALRRVSLTVHLPPSFPEKYRDAVVRAAESCKVKRTLLDPPEVAVRAEVAAIDRVA